MIKQGFDVNFTGTTNFQAVPLWNEVGGFGAVTNFLSIPRTDVDRLATLQPADNWTLDQKMNWLVAGTSGRPYMFYDAADEWRTAAAVKWGSIAFGGQSVMVDRVDTIQAKPPDGITRPMQMGRLVCFRKTDWDKSFNEAPYWIHQATAAGVNNVYNPMPRGVMYSPLWSPLDWDYPGTVQPSAFYLPMEWLE